MLTDYIPPCAGAVPAPLTDRAATLTPLGHAAVAGYRFVKALRALPAEQRAEALAMFTPEVRDVVADLAAGA